MTLLKLHIVGREESTGSLTYHEECVLSVSWGEILWCVLYLHCNCFHGINIQRTSSSISKYSITENYDKWSANFQGRHAESESV